MSVSLTISNLDDETYRRLQAEAQRRGEDVESIAKNALAKGLAAEKAAPLPEGPPYHDLDFLAGTWSEEEYQQFMAAVADFGRIDSDMWQ